jgi:hypothetical protein
LTDERHEIQRGFGTGLRRALEQRQEPGGGEKPQAAQSVAQDESQGSSHVTIPDPFADRVAVDQRIAEIAVREAELHSLAVQLHSERERLEQREQRLAAIDESLSDRIREAVQREAEIEAREARLGRREETLAQYSGQQGHFAER